MWKALLVFSALLFSGFPAPAQQNEKPTEYKIPPEAAKQVNPKKPTSESIAQGKKTYGYDCAMCHGEDGSGKGDLAAGMNLNLADYRDPETLKGRTDGELFYIIQNGKDKMPSEGDRAKPDQIWNLVNYIRAFAKVESSAKGKESAP
jgi:mono/diheme cytochrome c family protein